MKNFENEPLGNNKNALITITGTYMDNGTPETIETIQHGRYYKKNNRHVVEYNEQFPSVNIVQTGDIPITKNYVIMDDDVTVVQKEGEVTTNMIFKKSLNHKDFYQTPYGTLDMDIYTHKYEFKCQNDRITLELDYEISIGNDIYSKHKLKYIIETEE